MIFTFTFEFKLISFKREFTFDNEVSPYIHVFVFHCAKFIEKYSSLEAFQMENIERLNYVNKIIFFRASNKRNKKNSIADQVFEQSILSKGHWVKIELCLHFLRKT